MWQTTRRLGCDLSIKGMKASKSGGTNRQIGRELSLQLALSCIFEKHFLLGLLISSQKQNYCTCRC
jgi:hypothetical protein